MSIYANKNNTYTLVPEEDGKIYVANGSAWASVKEVWGAEEDPFNVGQFLWKRIWKVIPPAPAGVSIDSITQEFFFGGSVIVGWTNTQNVDGLAYDVEWYINGVSYTITSGAVNGSNLTQTTSLAESNFSNGDEVKARMRYVSAGVPGTYGAFSDEITYFL